MGECGGWAGGVLDLRLLVPVLEFFKLKTPHVHQLTHLLHYSEVASTLSTSQEDKLAWLKGFDYNHIVSRHGPMSKIEVSSSQF